MLARPDRDRPKVEKWKGGKTKRELTAEAKIAELQSKLESATTTATHSQVEALTGKLARARAELDRATAIGAERRADLARLRHRFQSIADLAERVQAKAAKKKSNIKASRKAEAKAIRDRTDFLKKRLKPKVEKPRHGTIVQSLRGIFVEIGVAKDRRFELAAAPVQDDTVKRDADGWRIDQEAPPQLIAPPAPPLWTPRHVRVCLVEAFRIIDRTPMAIWPKRKGASWINYLYETGDLVAQASSGLIGRSLSRRARGGVSIQEMRECNAAIEWQLRYLRNDGDAARAVGLDALWEAREQSASEELSYVDPSMSDRSFFRWKERGYNTISAGLNKDGVPPF